MRKIFSLIIAVLVPLLTLQVASTLHAGADGRNAAAGLRRFTLDEAVYQALRQNPDILRALQEIERVKGVVLQVQGQALPHADVIATFSQRDENLRNFGSGVVVTTTGGGTVVPPTTEPTVTATPTTGGTAFVSRGSTDRSYNLRFQGSQVIVAGGAIRGAIREADFLRDASYSQLRNVVDQVIANVRQQFFQVLLNRALIGVQEESVRLLESQLQDQQNRFEAGTVPRFNVLQAQVAVSNQRPELITARNNYRIAQLQLARLLGLNYNPDLPPGEQIEVVGELDYTPRSVSLELAIEIAKARRAFLAEQRAQIQAQQERVRIAFAGYLPTIRANGGYEFQSSPFTDNVRDAQGGYFLGATGDWPIFDGFETTGRVKQARALLETARINYADAVRQVELEVQQAYSNLIQSRELIQSQSENVGQADEALRLASARLSAGAGTQLEVLNARVEVTRAQSIRLQALFNHAAAVAEFDRVTGTDTLFHVGFNDPRPTPRTRKVRVEKKKAPTPRPQSSSRGLSK